MNRSTDHLRHFVDRLFGDLDATVAAVVADGWPEPMVRAGFALHRQTWRADDVAAALAAELGGWGGLAALDGFVDVVGRPEVRLVPPAEITHIWPALPGAGLTPVLFGALLGVPQRIRPSSRGRRFAEHVVDCWPDEACGAGQGCGPDKAPTLELVEPGGSWRDSDVVVVSGSDETVDEVRRQAPQARVTGYGHRVSFAVVVDADEVDLADVAGRVATDVVMWHQQGCFSARAVLFCGEETRRERFGELLGEAIAAEETRLGATQLDKPELAARAQARGVAEFTSTLWGDGVGWAQLEDGPFTGARPAAHVVTLHPVASPGDLGEAVAVAPRHLQGVALEAPDHARPAWANALSGLGVTRICRAGRLQAPPAGWLHDGRPNVLGWLRVVVSS